jgi:hypothetical protein
VRLSSGLRAKLLEGSSQGILQCKQLSVVRTTQLMLPMLLVAWGYVPPVLQL